LTENRNPMEKKGGDKTPKRRTRKADNVIGGNKTPKRRTGKMDNEIPRKEEAAEKLPKGLWVRFDEWFSKKWWVGVSGIVALATFFYLIWPSKVDNQKNDIENQDLPKSTNEAQPPKPSINIDVQQTQNPVINIDVQQTQKETVTMDKETFDYLLQMIAPPQGAYGNLSKETIAAAERNQPLITAENYFKQGMVYYNNEIFYEAANYFREAINKNPYYVAAYLGMGFSLELNGNSDEAKEYFRKAINLNFDVENAIAEGYSNWGVRFLDNGNSEKAIEYFQKAIDYKSDFAVAYAWMGWAYYQKGNFDLAIKHSLEAIDLYSEHAGTEKVAFAYATMGMAYYQKENFDLAIKYCLEARRLDPEHANACAFIGMAYYRKGHYDFGKEDFDDGIGNFDLAIKYCLEATRINTEFADAYAFIGMAYFYKGDNDFRKEDFDASIGKFDLAIKYFLYAIDLYSKHAGTDVPYFYAYLGMSYVYKGDYYIGKGDFDVANRNFDVAIKYCEIAIDKIPANEFPILYYFIGTAYGHLGNQIKADDFYKKAEEQGFMPK